jgi:tetratricopeptide (TPR) repeat protein
VAAERHLERALALREQALGPDHVEVARVLVLLSGVIFQRSYQNGRAEAVRAASFLERALAIQERLGRSDRLLTAETSNTLINVASALGQHGRATEAEALYRRFIAVVERIYGPQSKWVAMATANLSSFYAGQSRHAEAEANLRRSVRLQAPQEGTGHRETRAGELLQFASLCQRLGRWAEAADLLREALTISEADWGPEAPGLIHPLTALAEVCLGLQRYEEAEQLLQRAQAIEQRAREKQGARFSEGFAYQTRKTTLDLLKATGRYSQAWELENREQHPIPRGDVFDEIRDRARQPPPHPEEEPEFVWISALWVGYVTEGNAAVRWQVTGDAPAQLWERQVYQGGMRGSGGHVGGGLQGLDHAHTLSFHGSTHPTEVQVAAESPRGIDVQIFTLTSASVSDPGGSPRIVVESSARLLGRPDSAEVTVRLSNQGDGEARRTRIDQVVPAEGWELLPESLPAPRLPEPLNLGRIGAGAAGLFVVRLLRRRGDAAPAVRLHGTYADVAGERRAFSL